MNSLIAQFKELPSFVSKAPAVNFPFSLLEEGLPQGALVEVSGVLGGGKTEAVLQFLSENPSPRVAWIESELTVYPCSFVQAGVALERVLFVEAGTDALWATRQVLQTQVFGIVVLYVAVREENELRRLQIAAERSGSTLILLTESALNEGTWPISVQLQIQRSGQSGPLDLRILKYRGQRAWQSKSA